MEEPFNIVNFFFDSAKKYPDKIAIVHNDNKITFSDLEQAVKSTASYFIHKGITKGDRVMLFVPMGIDLYRIVLALFHVGATAVFLDEWVSRKRMEECCKVAQCKAFIGIFKARIYSFFISELRRIPIKLGTSYQQQKAIVNTNVYASDVALITFTTGSTGIPKAAKRTHAFLREQFNALIEKIEPKPDDIDMPVLPIVLLINLGIGCTSVIAKFKASKPESLNPEDIIQQIRYHRVNRIVSSPFFLKRISTHLIKNHTTCPSVEKIFTGGAPVFPTEAALYTKAFPGAKVEIVYGSTEAEPISSIDANHLLNEKESFLKTGLHVGVPYRKTRTRIIKIMQGPVSCNHEADLDGITLPPGQIGEIIVNGPHVLKEYFNNERALIENKIFIDQNFWHRTGDSGYLDKHGSLFLTGRCSMLIHIHGRLIAPFIYEGFFQSIEEIEIGTVMQLDNKLKAVIELKDQNKREQTIQRIRSMDINLDEIKFVPKIPRDPRHHSKIDYEKLKKSF